MTKFKIFILLIMFSFVSVGQTNQLTSAKLLFEKLNSGEDINVVIHYVKCKLIIDGKETVAPDAVGGMKLLPFEYFAKMSVRNDKAYATASETKLISHRGYGYVLNYVKIRIFEDDTVEIIARYLDPLTYEEKMDEMFKAVINDGTNDGGVFLYLK